MKNYTEAELMSMPLKIVRNLEIDTKEQETLVQSVVNRRLAVLPPSQAIYRRDVPEIQNQEQEAEWQEVINKRMAKLRPSLMDFDAPPSEPETPQEPEPDIPMDVQAGLLDPTAEDFNPLKLDLASKTGEGQAVIMGKAGAMKMEDGMTATPGKPVTLRGGVPSNLTRKPASKPGRPSKKK